MCASTTAGQKNTDQVSTKLHRVQSEPMNTDGWIQCWIQMQSLVLSQRPQNFHRCITALPAFAQPDNHTRSSPLDLIRSRDLGGPLLKTRLIYTEGVDPKDASLVVKA